jgi:anti-sigma B factor antagonist
MAPTIGRWLTAGLVMCAERREGGRMEITHKRLNRVDLLTIVGRLDAASAPQLRQQIEALFDEGRSRLVLDLAGLEYVASPGLRVLIEARKRARDRKLTDLEGGDVRIANLPPRIKEVFDLTGFTSLFEIFPDTVEAVGSF